MPSFDFKSTLKSFCDHDKLYIRDLDRNYYLNGIKYSATSIAELTSLILQYIHNKNYKNVTTIGSSSGGFAALLYGNLINADHMIAFNPQTVLGEKNITEINDDIFGPPINAMLRGIKNQDKLYQKSLNLRNFIPFKGKAVIHYSSESLSGIDQRYAKYLQHGNCCVIPYKSTTHLLALQLKEQNLLFEIIANTINS